MIEFDGWVSCIRSRSFVVFVLSDSLARSDLSDPITIIFGESGHSDFRIG